MELPTSSQVGWPELLCHIPETRNYESLVKCGPKDKAGALSNMSVWTTTPGPIENKYKYSLVCFLQLFQAEICLLDAEFRKAFC